MGLDYSNINTTDDWAIRITEQVNGSHYYNPPGGVELYDKEKFKQSNIQLVFLQPELKEYNQFREIFEPALSIVDIMMFNSPAEIKTMLNDYQLL